MAALALITTGPMNTQATEHTVLVDGNGFSPATLLIEQGDTVVWINNDELDFPHTITSSLNSNNSNYWNGLVFGYTDTFTNEFPNLGSFTYFDQFDVGTGTITVVPAGVPIPLELSAPRKVGTQFLFDGINLITGSTNAIETSTNLVDWTRISTNVVPGTTFTFTNTYIPGRQFFRGFKLP